MMKGKTIVRSVLDALDPVGAEWRERVERLQVQRDELREEVERLTADLAARGARRDESRDSIAFLRGTPMEAAKLPQSEVIPCCYPDCDTARALRVGFDAARREGMDECEWKQVPIQGRTMWQTACGYLANSKHGATVCRHCSKPIADAIRAEAQGRKGRKGEEKQS